MKPAVHGNGRLKLNGNTNTVTAGSKVPFPPLLGSQLDWYSLFRIIEGVAQGMYCLHEQGIVHLDLKPSNVLLDSDMNPKIVDFGISELLHDNKGDAHCSAAWEAREDGRMDELFDPELLGDESQLMEIKRCIEVALLCTQFDQADRPPMEEFFRCYMD
nr:unnamed protein product [Digitaria exilis]